MDGDQPFLESRQHQTSDVTGKTAALPRVFYTSKEMWQRVNLIYANDMLFFPATMLQWPGAPRGATNWPAQRWCHRWCLLRGV